MLSSKTVYLCEKWPRLYLCVLLIACGCDRVVGWINSIASWYATAPPPVSSGDLTEIHNPCKCVGETLNDYKVYDNHRQLRVAQRGGDRARLRCLWARLSRQFILVPLNIKRPSVKGVDAHFSWKVVWTRVMWELIMAVTTEQSCHCSSKSSKSSWRFHAGLYFLWWKWHFGGKCNSLIN